MPDTRVHDLFMVLRRDQMRHLNRPVSQPRLRLAVATMILACVAAAFAATSADASSNRQGQQPKAAGPVGHLHVLLAQDYRSLGELKRPSVAVVLGIVTAQRGESGTAAKPIPSTISTFQVQQIVWSSGTVASLAQEVQIRQFGGTDAAGGRVVDDDFPPLAVGARYVVFLSPTAIDGQYAAMGAYEGVFAVSATGSVSSYNLKSDAGGVRVAGTSLDRFIRDVQSA